MGAHCGDPVREVAVLLLVLLGAPLLLLAVACLHDLRTGRSWTRSPAGGHDPDLDRALRQARTTAAIAGAVVAFDVAGGDGG